MNALVIVMYVVVAALAFGWVSVLIMGCISLHTWDQKPLDEYRTITRWWGRKEIQQKFSAKADIVEHGPIDVYLWKTIKVLGK